VSADLVKAKRNQVMHALFTDSNNRSLVPPPETTSLLLFSLYHKSPYDFNTVLANRELFPFVKVHRGFGTPTTRSFVGVMCQYALEITARSI
jgi:hypothetical protein